VRPNWTDMMCIFFRRLLVRLSAAEYGDTSVNRDARKALDR